MQQHEIFPAGSRLGIFSHTSDVTDIGQGETYKGRSATVTFSACMGITSQKSNAVKEAAISRQLNKYIA
jgi:hypothetical protein